MSKLLISNDVRPLQSLNIMVVLVKLLVLLPLKEASTVEEGIIVLLIVLMSALTTTLLTVPLIAHNTLPFGSK